jgi:MraZ protein
VKFYGEHERQIDEKSRLALPSEHRDELGQFCFLTKGMDRCIAIYTEEDFADVAAGIVAEVAAGRLHRNVQRSFAASATRVRIDAQGRIMLPEALLQFADLAKSSPAVVVGNVDTVEVWMPARRVAVDEDGTMGEGGWQGNPLVGAAAAAAAAARTGHLGAPSRSADASANAASPEQRAVRFRRVLEDRR